MGRRHEDRHGRPSWATERPGRVAGYERAPRMSQGHDKEEAPETDLTRGPYCGP